MTAGLGGKRVRELVRGICQESEVEILQAHSSKDHVHLVALVARLLAISKLAQ